MDMLPDLLQFFAGGLDISNLPNPPGADDGSILKTILNVVLVITGAIAVLSVVISGVRFITSQGNPSETSKARNGIVFSVIGLLVVMFAFSIVNFVVFRVT